MDFAIFSQKKGNIVGKIIFFCYNEGNKNIHFFEKMKEKHKKTSFFRFIVERAGLGFFTALFTLVLFSFGQVSFATLSGTAPNGELQGGSFVHWIHQVLVSPPADSSVTLSNPTIRSASSLANTTGSIGASAKDFSKNTQQYVGVGIGTQAPGELLHIKGDTPVTEIFGRNGSAELQFSDGISYGSISFDPLTKELVFGKNGNVLDIKENGEGNASGKVTVTKNATLKQVTLAGQLCLDNEYMYAIDSNGRILCKSVNTSPPVDSSACYFDTVNKRWEGCDFGDF